VHMNVRLLNLIRKMQHKYESAFYSHLISVTSGFVVSN
jgi:hypothetical protein